MGIGVFWVDKFKRKKGPSEIEHEPLYMFFRAEDRGRRKREEVVFIYLYDG